MAPLPGRTWQARESTGWKGADYQRAMPGLKGVRGGQGPTGDWIAQRLLGCTRSVQPALPGTAPPPPRQPAHTVRAAGT